MIKTQVRPLLLLGNFTCTSIWSFNTQGVYPRANVIESGLYRYQEGYTNLGLSLFGRRSSMYSPA